MTLSAKNQGRVLFAASSLIPMIPMLYLYQQNADYVLFAHMLAAAFFAALSGALIYTALDAALKNKIAAFAASIAAWLVFFSYSGAYRFLNNAYGVRNRHLLPAVAAVFLALLLLARHAFSGRPLSGDSSAFAVAAFTFTCLLLVWNIAGAAYAYARFHKYDDSENNLVKTDFFIDDSITSLPDIYWIHCDGMLGFDAMEKYFGDSQPELERFLTQNGFEINKRASFDANHRTVQAVPMLMCPGFYDAVIQGVEGGIPQDELMNRVTLNQARMNNEIMNALSLKGYNTVIISGIGSIFQPTADFIYDLNSEGADILVTDSVLKGAGHEEITEKLDAITNAENLYFLLREATMLGVADRFFWRIVLDYKENVIKGAREEVPYYPEEVAAIQERDVIDPYYENLMRGLLHSREVEGPKFVIACFIMAHSPFVYDENGQRHNKPAKEAAAIESYPPNHAYTAKVLSNMVSAIIEKNPDAAIILQADHGLHQIPGRDIISALGSAEAVGDIRNGVMSAVRIPEKYGPPKEILEPLDISRYLINNYAGKNYEYLSYGAN